jgi:2-polyprenyl-6-methoxyphenol hydroxylase-like FAD-dependent oxidoreductase
MMRKEAWESVRIIGRDRLPPQLSEMAEKTRVPFVQAITDFIAPTNPHWRAVLVGDALAGFRPHTVASMSQAVYDVTLLADWLKGESPDKIPSSDRWSTPS